MTIKHPTALQGCQGSFLWEPNPANRLFYSIIWNTVRAVSSLYFFLLCLDHCFELDEVLLCVSLLGKTNNPSLLWWQQALADAGPWRGLWQILAALTFPSRILAEWIQKSVQILLVSVICRTCSSSPKKLLRGMKYGDLYLVTTVLLSFRQVWETSCPLSSIG